MAASNAVDVYTVLPGGLALEKGTYTSSGGTATLTISAQTTTQPEIVEIVAWGCASDGDDAALVAAKDVELNQLKLTFTANDTGDYWFIGKTA